MTSVIYTYNRRSLNTNNDTAWVLLIMFSALAITFVLCVWCSFLYSCIKQACKPKVTIEKIKTSNKDEKKKGKASVSNSDKSIPNIQSKTSMQGVSRIQYFSKV